MDSPLCKCLEVILYGDSSVFSKFYGEAMKNI